VAKVCLSTSSSRARFKEGSNPSRKFATSTTAQLQQQQQQSLPSFYPSGTHGCCVRLQSCVRSRRTKKPPPGDDVLRTVVHMRWLLVDGWMYGRVPCSGAVDDPAACLRCLAQSVNPSIRQSVSLSDRLSVNQSVSQSQALPRSRHTAIDKRSLPQRRWAPADLPPAAEDREFGYCTLVLVPVKLRLGRSSLYLVPFPIRVPISWEKKDMQKEVINMSLIGSPHPIFLSAGLPPATGLRHEFAHENAVSPVFLVPGIFPPVSPAAQSISEWMRFYSCTAAERGSFILSRYQFE
jgi:hypothetical protein